MLGSRLELGWWVHSCSTIASSCAYRRWHPTTADIEKADNAGHTPLLSAAHFGDLDMIELLVEEGADLEAKDPANGMVG